MAGDVRFNAERWKLPSPWNSAYADAWAVRYQLLSQDSKNKRAVVNLYLTDAEPGVKSSETVPFVVDTGSPFTIVPDSAVPFFRDTTRRHELTPYAGRGGVATWRNLAA